MSAHLQPRVEHAERVALRQQHEQAVQRPQQAGHAARLQQLQPQEGEAGGLQQRHKAVDLGVGEVQGKGDTYGVAQDRKHDGKGMLCA